MYDPYNFAPLWLVWGFIDQNSKMAEIVYFIIKKITNTYKISRGFESFLSGGLTVIISQFQKVYEWSSCHFVKMVIYFAICELRRFFASHARTFAHSIFGRTHIARTCAFCQNLNRTRTRTFVAKG